MSDKIKYILEILSDEHDIEELEGFIVVEEGDWKEDGKVCFLTTIVKVDSCDEWFEITLSKSNSGYWRDGESYEPEVRRVVPSKKVVEIVEWKEFKNV